MEQVDSTGTPGLACRKSAGPGHHCCHNSVNQLMKRALFGISINSCSVGAVVSQSPDGKRPHGLTVVSWTRGRCSLYGTSRASRWLLLLYLSHILTHVFAKIDMCYYCFTFIKHVIFLYIYCWLCIWSRSSIICTYVSAISVLLKLHARLIIRANLIHRCFTSKSCDLLIKAFKTYVRPILEFSSSVW